MKPLVSRLRAAVHAGKSPGDTRKGSVELKGKPDADSGPPASYYRPFTRNLIAMQGGIEIDRKPLAVYDNEAP